MDHIPHEELLESNHTFPGIYHFKAIGEAHSDFADRVQAAAASQLENPSGMETSIRETKGGRHVAVTLEVLVQSAEQVRAIYAAIRQVEGLALLL